MEYLSIFLKLIRIKHWYKNIIIFLPLVFSFSLFHEENFIQTIMGFFSLCLISSAMYIRNDIIDIELDKNHPIKKLRPITAGKISIKKSNIIFLLLLLSGFIIGFLLSWKFTVMLILLCVNTMMYSKWLKHIAFVDLLSISVNYIIRVYAGIFLLDVSLSLWLTIGVFLVALFLGFMKRKGEILILKEKTIDHRRSLSKYSLKIVNLMLLSLIALIIIVYSSYVVLINPTGNFRLIITIPIVCFIAFRQYYLSESNASIQKFSEVINDKITLLAIILYIVVTIGLLYFSPN